MLPKSVNAGWIVKNFNADGSPRYDFSFENRRGYKTTVEGLSGRFNKEYWNYAKLISGVLRYRMPVDNCDSTHRIAATRKRHHQHLESRGGACPQKICYRRR